MDRPMLILGIFVVCMVYVVYKNWNRTKPPLLAKDPLDWTLTENSTKWKNNYYCLTCKSKVGHHEAQVDICNSCGSSRGMSRRSSRKIWNGEIWATQHKYRDGKYTVCDESGKEILEGRW